MPVQAEVAVFRTNYPGTTTTLLGDHWPNPLKATRDLLRLADKEQIQKHGDALVINVTNGKALYRLSVDDPNEPYVEYELVESTLRVEE